MKEQASLKFNTIASKVPLAVRVAAVHFALAILGVLSSKVKLVSVLTPVGVILSAAVPVGYSLSSGIGAFLGYLFLPGSDTPFRYIAALFAVISIRLLTVSFKKITATPAFCGMVVLVSQTVCNLVTCMSGENNTLLLLSEGVLAGGLTYFVSRAVNTDFRSGTGLTGEELASVVITIDLALVALVPLSISGMSVGRIITVTLILASARFGGVAGGSVAGTAMGFAIALSGNDAGLMLLYALGGMVSGLFATGGRVMSILGFLVPSLISLGVFGVDNSTVVMVLEIILGIAIFMLLPKVLCVGVASFFAPSVKLESLEGMRKSLVVRLKYASGALCDVSGTIEEVAKRLRRINRRDPSDMFHRCETETCAGCSFRINCWETERRETMRALGLISTGIREGDSDIKSKAPEFAQKCLRPEAMLKNLKENYEEYLSELKAEDRIEQVRGVVADQFDGISDMLLDLANEFDSARHYDLDMAETVVSALREINLLSSDCGCSIDKYGRMTIEVKLHNVEKQTVNRKRILDQLETACEKRFEPPTIRNIDDILYVTVTERANFTPEIGVTQIPATETGICGDSYSYFGDGSGRYYMLLSDGMGTGGRAAVDGAMTTGLMERLIKAGFGFDCSLRIVNSALLYKSCEESLSTVDIAAIDLYTGEIELYKAGAAPTFVKRSGRVGRAESHSLPVGILRDVGFDRSGLTLKRDDIVVIVSDGACTDGSDWICREIENFGDGTAQQLADKIAEAAVRRADKTHQDDITVMVTLLNKRL